MLLYLIGLILVSILIAATVALIGQIRKKEQIVATDAQEVVTSNPPENKKSVEIVKGNEVVAIQLNKNSQGKETNRYDAGIVICFMLSTASILFAIFQLYADENDLNLYVGGDAYNYIISSNYATGYFILGLLFAMSSFAMMIINEIRDIKDKLVDNK